MLHNLTGWHAFVILAIIILVFGAAKLPALAKSLGQSVRILKDETTEKRPSGSGAQAPAHGHHEAVTDPLTTTSATHNDQTHIDQTHPDSQRASPTTAEPRERARP